MTALTCEQIARAALGEPAERKGGELVWRCAHPERHQHGDAHPSLKVNPQKDVFLCGPCGAKGKGWALAAFIVGVDAGDKGGVRAWLRGKGLLNGAKRKAKADGRGPCVAIYTYTDTQGNPVARKLRFEPGANGRKKDFAWEHAEGDKWVSGLGNVKTPLYRIANIVNEPLVVLTEGEKDADAGANAGLPTATSGGSGSWREDHAGCLRGKRVVIVADADNAGRIHAQKVAASLHGKAASVCVCEVPGCKDLAEAIEHGWTRERLLSLFAEAAEWKPATGSPSGEPRTLAELRRFSDIAPEPLRWLWPWRIPLGKLTLFVGDPGLGKSLTTIDIAARVSNGSAFPDGAPCERGSVIILSAEDDPADTIRPRLDAAGADVSRVHLLEAVRVVTADGKSLETGFSLERDIPALEDALNQTGARLVNLDPVSAYLGGTDSHANAEVRGLLAPLAALAAKHGVAVIAVTHLRKSAGAAIHRAIGSLAFAAGPRAVWGITADPEDKTRRLFVNVKMNLAPDGGGLAYRIEASNGIARVAWEAGAVAVDVNAAMGGFETPEGNSERKEAEEWLKEYLADGPVAASEVIRMATGAGISKATLWRAGHSLRVAKRKLGGRGAGWEWSLRKATPKNSPCPSSVCVNSLNSLEPLNSLELKNSKNSTIQHKDPLNSLAPYEEGEA